MFYGSPRGHKNITNPFDFFCAPPPLTPNHRGPKTILSNAYVLFVSPRHCCCCVPRRHRKHCSQIIIFVLFVCVPLGHKNNVNKSLCFFVPTRGTKTMVTNHCVFVVSPGNTNIMLTHPYVLLCPSGATKTCALFQYVLSIQFV